MGKAAGGRVAAGGVKKARAAKGDGPGMMTKNPLSISSISTMPLTVFSDSPKRKRGKNCHQNVYRAVFKIGLRDLGTPDTKSRVATIELCDAEAVKLGRWVDWPLAGEYVLGGKKAYVAECIPKIGEVVPGFVAALPADGAVGGGLRQGGDEEMGGGGEGSWSVGTFHAVAPAPVPQQQQYPVGGNLAWPAAHGQSVSPPTGGNGGLWSVEAHQADPSVSVPMSQSNGTEMGMEGGLGGNAFFDLASLPLLSEEEMEAFGKGLAGGQVVPPAMGGNGDPRFVADHQAGQPSPVSPAQSNGEEMRVEGASGGDSCVDPALTAGNGDLRSVEGHQAVSSAPVPTSQSSGEETRVEGASGGDPQVDAALMGSEEVTFDWDYLGWMESLEHSVLPPSGES